MAMSATSAKPAAIGRGSYLPRWPKPRSTRSEALLVERNSQRSIARIRGVARMTIAKQLKKAAAASPPLPRLRPKKAQRKEWEILELDERWSFVGHKKRNVRIWLAVERARRRTVGWTQGSRGEAPLRQLWQALPQRYHRHCWSFTDPWKAYAKVLPRWQHRPCAKGAGQTNIVEAINCSLRQRCSVPVRKSCSLSKSLAIHTARIKIIVDDYNRNIILD